MGKRGAAENLRQGHVRAATALGCMVDGGWEGRRREGGERGERGGVGGGTGGGARRRKGSIHHHTPLRTSGTSTGGHRQPQGTRGWSWPAPRSCPCTTRQCTGAHMHTPPADMRASVRPTRTCKGAGRHAGAQRTPGTTTMAVKSECTLSGLRGCRCSAAKPSARKHTPTRRPTWLGLGAALFSRFDTAT